MKSRIFENKYSLWYFSVCICILLIGYAYNVFGCCNPPPICGQCEVLDPVGCMCRGGPGSPCGPGCCGWPNYCNNNTCCPQGYKGHGWYWHAQYGWVPICCPPDFPEWCAGAVMCYNPDTEECCGPGICQKNNCESCVNDQCKVCGGDPNKACCNGQCYDTRTQGCCNGQIYNKQTQQCCTDITPNYICDIEKTCCNGSCISACYGAKIMDPSHQDCPGCAGGGCSGTYKVIEPSMKCAPEDSGYIGMTECHESGGEDQCYIYEWPCIPNYDCSNITYCAGLAIGCVASCGGAVCTKSPTLIAVCVGCIMANVSHPDCMNRCFYIEFCYYDNEDEPTCTGEQFDHFGGCLCIAP